jgi:aminoglycoside phosphotransferase (APT) family kinase protein
MGERQRQNAGTTQVRQGFDQERLASWMESHVDGFAGPLVVEQFQGGQSNPTYKLITPTHHYVMRRKPPGELVAGAHAVDREYRVIAALHAADFPVARPYALCLDADIIGSWFYIMDLVEGRSIWETSFPDVAAAERPSFFDAMNETLAQLHTLDPAALGLGDYGKQGGYIGRQLRRWTRQYREDEAAGRDPNLDRLAEWLPANIPPDDETRLIHGDFRCDNMIFHRSEPRVVAVLDWELSTLGHPLADFAFHAMIYRVPPTLITGLLGLDLTALNIPSEADYIAAYCRRTGREGIAHYDFYVAFNLFRLAAIMHGIKGRLLRGTAASGHARQMAQHVEPLAELGWRQIRP